MSNNIAALIPRATQSAPLRELEWIFSFVCTEKKDKHYNQAKNWYLSFVEQTYAGYSELEQDPRFFIEHYWQVDALIRFSNWLNLQKSIKSKTRYTMYKCVKTTMHYAYQLNLINHIVYHAPFFKGRSETDIRLPYAKSDQEVIDLALGRSLQLAQNVVNGYQKTGQGRFSITHSHRPFKANGKTYHFREAAEAFNIPIIRLRDRRVQSWSDLECLGLVERKRKRNNNLPPIEVAGRHFDSIAQAAEYHNISVATFHRHLSNGASLEQAAGLEPFSSAWDQYEVKLYDFENHFNCDPLLMLCESTYTKSSLKAFYRKIGVWPFVDIRIMMPLVAELAKLTGLNAESIASLEVDSYLKCHPLTNQPVINYTKARSGSKNLTEDKSLHIPLLESTEIAINEEVAKQVDHLFNLVKKLTAKIRPFATGIASKKLFIFEHDLWDTNLNNINNVYKNHKANRRVSYLYFGNPTPKHREENPDLVNASVWKRAFLKETGLEAILGNNFNLNISRFRPTLINTMVKNGADLFEIQSTVGHKSVTTTNSYLSEQELEPEFAKAVKPALKSIVNQKSSQEKVRPIYNAGYTETLGGTGCKNAYNPSERVRKRTKHVEGSPCKYWNMCLLCEQSTITENSLPKIIAYKYKIEDALSASAKCNLDSRQELYVDTLEVINQILKPNEQFTEDVIHNAKRLANELDDEALDFLVYQGTLEQ